LADKQKYSFTFQVDYGKNKDNIDAKGGDKHETIKGTIVKGSVSGK